MCMGGSPSVPAPPPLPPEPPPPPTEVDPAVKQSRQTAKARASASMGRDNTILTSAQGLTSDTANTRKTLLGQ